MTDEQKAAIIAFLNALIPFLVLIGAVSMDEKALAAAGLVTTTSVTMVALFFRRRATAN